MANTRVIVADDNKELVLMISEFLKMNGYDVVAQFNSGNELNNLSLISLKISVVKQVIEYLIRWVIVWKLILISFLISNNSCLIFEHFEFNLDSNVL